MYSYKYIFSLNVFEKKYDFVSEDLNYTDFCDILMISREIMPLSVLLFWAYVSYDILQLYKIYNLPEVDGEYIYTYKSKILLNKFIIILISK